MNEVTPLQVKSHWPTLKEFDCIIQTQNCVGRDVWLWPSMSYSDRGELLKMNVFQTVQVITTKLSGFS